MRTFMRARSAARGDAWALPVAAVALLAASCGGPGAAQHPLTNRLDPGYGGLKLATLGAMPFWSDISENEDPDHLSGPMAESKFYRALGPNTGFTVLTSSEVGALLEKSGKTAQLAAFYKKWVRDQDDVDKSLVQFVAQQMKVDAVIVGAVDVWDQQKVDITESGTARTSVGLLVGLIDGATGKTLWVGRDENYKEALRYVPGTEQGRAGTQAQRSGVERTNLRTATGVYAPPDFSDVVDIVVASLVKAFPPRRT